MSRQPSMRTAAPPLPTCSAANSGTAASAEPRSAPCSPCCASVMARANSRQSSKPRTNVRDFSSSTSAFHPSASAKMKHSCIEYTDAMARLRHIAVVVKDLEKAAAFYEKVFELERVGEEHIEMGSAIYLSDGVINLALLKYKGEAGSGTKDAAEFVGAHHFGF